MIRAATPEDCEIVSGLGEAFFTEAGWSDIAEYSAQDCLKSLRFLATDTSGLLLVAEEDGEIVGMAGGLISPLYFNFSHLTGQELFWWVKPGKRGGLGMRLIEALERAAKERGCASWAMIALDRVEPERVGAIYQRRGYRASEHSYIKRL